MPNIKSIAIIGAGPAGLSAAYEFLHTTADGAYSPNEIPKSRAFEKIVIFEQQENIGGIWNSKVNDPDLGLPPKDFLINETYNDPDEIHPNKFNSFSSTFQDAVKNSDSSHPISVDKSSGTYKVGKEEHDENINYKNYIQWSKSAVYDGLFTNVPKQFLRFSNYINPNIETPTNDFERKVNPLINYKKMHDTLKNFAETQGIIDLISFKTEVESISKDQKDQKWNVIVRHETENEIDVWYKESFDAVLVANGHYSIPYIPKIPGLGKYELAHPGSIIHNKAWRDPELYRGKKVVFIGGGISSVDILQYVVPIASKTIVSRRNYGTEKYRPAAFEWLDEVIESGGIQLESEIVEFNSEEKTVKFANGNIEKDVDNFIFCTGYHWHFPFLNKKYVEIKNPTNDAKSSSSSRIKGLYQHIFSIDDPTLAFGGMKITSMKWLTMETSNAAIAGVWSGYSKLPSKEEQLEWENKLVEKLGDNVGFHYSKWDIIKHGFVEDVMKLATKDRLSPYDLFSDEYINTEFESTQEVLEGIFMKFKKGELKYAESV